MGESRPANKSGVKPLLNISLEENGNTTATCRIYMYKGSKLPCSLIYSGSSLWTLFIGLSSGTWIFCEENAYVCTFVIMNNAVDVPFMEMNNSSEKISEWRCTIFLIGHSCSICLSYSRCEIAGDLERMRYYLNKIARSFREHVTQS